MVMKTALILTNCLMLLLQRVKILSCMPSTIHLKDLEYSDILLGIQMDGQTLTWISMADVSVSDQVNISIILG